MSATVQSPQSTTTPGSHPTDAQKAAVGMTYGRARSSGPGPAPDAREYDCGLGGGAAVSWNAKATRNDSTLSTNFRLAEGCALGCGGGRRWMRSALPGGGGIRWSRDSESPLWYGGVGGKYTDVELREKALKIERGRGLAADDDEFVRDLEGAGATVDVRNGREIVVTRIEFLSSDLSGTFSGMKLTIASNGRWEGSGGGREVCPRLSENEAAIEDGRDDGLESTLRCEDELPGEVGVDRVPKRSADGGARSLLMSTASENSSTPSPPCLRQAREIRSAHSSTVTKRTAPVSSSASGAERWRIRTAGMARPGMSGGLWVARITRDLANWRDWRRGASSLRVGARRGFRTSWGYRGRKTHLRERG